MALDGKTGIRSSDVSPVGSDCLTPEVSPCENHSSSFESQDNFSPRHSIIIPNRLFIGGFDYKISERELWHIFSTYGTIREINIVQNSSRLTKGFGFITFENSEDVRRLLLDANGFYYRGKRLSIRQAVRRQRNSQNSNGPMQQMPCGTVYHTTSSGFPYTFHNGVAYFHGPRVIPGPHLWTPPPAPVMVPQPCQPVYQQHPYLHYQPRCFPNHYQWNNVEAPISTGPVIYAQPEYLHHVPDGAPLHQPPLPFMDDNNTEYYDAMMYENYPMYPHRERIPRFVAPHEYGKNHVDPSFQVPSAQVYNYNRDHPSAPEPEPEPEPEPRPEPEPKPEPEGPQSAQ